MRDNVDNLDTGLAEPVPGAPDPAPSPFELTPSWLGEPSQPLRLTPQPTVLDDPDLAYWQRPGRDSPTAHSAPEPEPVQGPCELDGTGPRVAAPDPVPIGHVGRRRAPEPVAVAEPPPPPAALAPTEAFSMPVQEVPRDGWLDPRLHGARPGWTEPPPKRPVRAPKRPRRLGVALPLLVLLALAGGFFSWVSAEPMWLSLGHGRTGTLTITACSGEGFFQSCVGEFSSAGFTAADIDVYGPPGQSEGLSAPARMVGPHSTRAYVASGTGGLYLRWLVGLAAILLCSVGIVFATGALRLPDRRDRLAAVGLSFAGPLLVSIGFLAATF
ncbi:hypothetical protein Cs7R123_77230 [Catellatospora sp. TT07R-123]|uniref:hypothetical protein n=1 Tax=Catellatospora sp. TT07R-123 TaxID=2733863 RepID=UPI001B16D3A3|nr:hypothetical protein [Catellatospora sp. TT07R-123]GHJ50381.1 hypothetical protein Cs7R123_77230 [Catellatospora sp. TT07R-123]